MKTTSKYRSRKIAATFVAAICCAAAAASVALAAENETSTSDSYAAALDHFRAERWSEAASELQSFIQSSPATNDERLPSAEYYLAESLLRGGRPADAIDWYRKLLDGELDAAARSIVRFRLGEAAFLSRRYPLAIAELQALIDDAPRHATSARALHYLGEAAYATKDYFTAEAALAQAAATFPDDAAYPRVIVLQACAHMQLRQVREAWTVLAPLYFDTSSEKADPFVVQLAATLLSAVGRDDDAATAYETIASESTTADRKFDALIALAEIRRRQERWEEATRSARDALAVASDERKPHVLQLTAEIELARGLPEDADATYARLINDFPQHELVAAAQLQRGRIAQETGDWDTASERFAELCERPALTAELRNEAWQGRLQALAQARRWSELTDLAVTARKAVSTEALRAEIDYLEGRAYLGRAELDRAREAFSRCLSNKSISETEIGALAQFMTGETYFLQRRYQEAVVEYGQVSSHETPHWQAAALLQRGKCREQLNQTAEARADYEALLHDFAESAFATEARSRLEACVTRSAAAPSTTRTER